MSTAALSDSPPASAPLFLPFARLPLWRRVVVLVGLGAPLFIWSHEVWSNPRDALTIGTFLLAPVVAATGLSFLNHPGAQLIGRGVAWFQLLVGTVAGSGAHLHISVSDAAGRVYGGHVGYGCTVRTTAEVLLTLLPEWSLGREMDPATGFSELVVRRRDAG